jgi:TetR/AcrR family transcriptional regulator
VTMPRPVHAPAGKPRREEILDEATRLFAERGYEGASMADLADAVGMRKASLFYHFASKEVLYAAVFERLLVSFGSAIANATLIEGSFEERLDRMTEGIVRVLGDQPFAARLLVREIMDWGPVMRAELSAGILTVIQAAVAFVQAGQGAGVFAEGDARHMVLSVISIHILPFAVPGVVGKLVESPTTDPAYVEARCDAVRHHVRAILLKR